MSTFALVLGASRRHSGVGLVVRLSRVVLLVLLVAAGTSVLLRYAPGYFSESREMDAQYAASARTELEARRNSDHSAAAMLGALAAGWLHGELGRSRQYDVPVTDLIRPRIAITLSLLARALALGWTLSVAIALPLSLRRGRTGESAITAGSALSLAIPISALATVFLLTGVGGPAIAAGLVIAARDFKFLYRLLRSATRAPHLLLARAQGLGPARLCMVHLLPSIRPQLLSLGTMSFVVALSLMVPAEVIFDVPGIGQLAWNAAMNRDLPVLLAVTLLLAALMGLAGLIAEPGQRAAAQQAQGEPA